MRRVCSRNVKIQKIQKIQKIWRIQKPRTFRRFWDQRAGTPQAFVTTIGTNARTAVLTTSESTNKPYPSLCLDDEHMGWIGSPLELFRSHSDAAVYGGVSITDAHMSYDI